MAGDWIPMRHDLWEAPQVVSILSALCQHSVSKASARCQIIGALYRTWCLIDRFAEDGILHGYTAELLDEEVGWEGWSENLEHVGWLVVEPQRLIVPEFEAWFSQSAKRRRSNAQYQRRHRDKRKQNVSTNADSLLTREEKRREEKSNKETKAKKARFTAPTKDQVIAYGREIGYDIDGEQFCDYYTTRGWVLSNGRQMRDWQAAVRTWKRNHRQRHGSEPASEDEAARAARKRAEDTRRLCEESLSVPDEPLSGESLVEEYRKRKGT